MNYLSLSDSNYDRITGLIRKSYPQACIVYIQTISNPTLDNEFESTKKEIPRQIKIQELFHGTKEFAISSICSSGFDPEYNKVGAYGKGTYFSPQASLSFNYTNKSKATELHYVFLADVIIGTFTRAGSMQEIDTTKYDNSCNDMKNPTIICTPYRYGAIPRYLIAFHKQSP
jgi:hypothetical protein